jgi:succinate dehydrogenase / fumarate reductase cytochrome b subunit
MPVRARPLSPHLSVYRWQIGNTLSILHRLTGIALALALAALCGWLMALAGGEQSYSTAMQIIVSPIGFLALFGWTFAFMYHLLNGIRHLFWDAGYGFERGARHASGWFAVIGAAVLATGVCFLIWHGVRS